MLAAAVNGGLLALGRDDRVGRASRQQAIAFEGNPKDLVLRSAARQRVSKDE